MKNLAPICLFTYNRFEETRQTVEALQKNFLAKESKLFIFSDGPKNDNTKTKVNEVRNYLKTITGFKKIEVIESATNKGLANSIISGVTKIIKDYGHVIVLEDDLLTSTNFLNFMNDALSFYENNSKVFSVSGYSKKMKFNAEYNYDTYSRRRNTSWGWATWLNRWETIDWEIKEWSTFSKDDMKIKEFNKGGIDLFPMLKKSIEGKNNSWAVKFGYNQFKKRGITIAPIVSKVLNVGFGSEATHCNTQVNVQKIQFDKTNKNNFIFQSDVRIIESMDKQSTYYNRPLGRIHKKLLEYFYSLNIVKPINVEYVK